MDLGLVILIGIAVFNIMIYLSTRSLVEVLNHWGVKKDNQIDDIKGLLEQIEMNTRN